MTVTNMCKDSLKNEKMGEDIKDLNRKLQAVKKKSNKNSVSQKYI